MKLTEKIKNIFSKTGCEATSGRAMRKTIGLFLLAGANLTTVFAISIAWFNMAAGSGNSEVNMVSGDLNVKINKITAYKYVYPFYRNSTRYVDYDVDGSIKRYVIQDNGYDSELDVNYSDMNISTNDAVITLGEQSNGTISTDGTGVLSPTHIHYPHYDEFRYYLIGDSVFCGDFIHGWSTNESVPFEAQANATIQNPVVVQNVMVSAGSTFILFDRKSVSDSNCKYLTYASVTPNSPFVILGGDEEHPCTRVKCVKGGVYSFSYNGSSITITRQNALSSIISNNSLDATLVKLNYEGSEEIKAEYGSLANYMPAAVKSQNTMVVFDVELDYQNVNKVRAGLKIERAGEPSNKAIASIENKYSNTTSYLTDSVLDASDFYSFYTVFTDAPYNASSSDPTVNQLWLAMHQNTNLVDSDTAPAFSKFANGETYDSVIDCRIHKKENLAVASSSDLEIEASNEPNIYHFYIGVEYDYSHTMFFTYEKRLGKTYTLSRDFTFYFTGEQVTES